MLAEQLSCINIFGFAVIPALTATFMNTSLKFLVPTCSFFATLLSTSSALITLNEHATATMLEERLISSSCAGVIAASFATIAKIPFFFVKIHVHGTHHDEGHNKKEKGKDVLDHHVG
mmetsp:Transcript_18640/g.24856  ORF Transcript_18640/g.24856 Transcript_18640/m.24856 type:complete len:118 (-) Transcript_18640:57-410(-)